MSADTRLRRRPFRVDLALTPGHRRAYLRMLGDRRTTLVRAIEWLHERGYRHLSWGAVHRHRRHFLAESDEARRTAMAAEQLAIASRSGSGRDLLADGACTLLLRQVVKALNDRGPEADRSPRTLATFARVLSDVLAVRARVEEVHAEAARDARDDAAIPPDPEQPPVRETTLGERIVEFWTSMGHEPPWMREAKEQFAAQERQEAEARKAKRDARRAQKAAAAAAAGTGGAVSTGDGPGTAVGPPPPDPGAPVASPAPGAPIDSPEADYIYVSEEAA